VDQVRRSLRQLRADGHVRYAYLGVATRSVYPQLADHFDLGTDGGAWVQSVTSGGPAAKAGLHGGTRSPETFQAQRYRSGGDVIVALAGRKVTEDADLARILIGHQPGQRVRVALRRDGAPRTVTVRLGRRPATTSP
jgi:2-alkenal reductase